jgi:perosamine synthetase
MTFMRIGRTLPPAASPIYPQDIVAGFKGYCQGNKAIKKLENELKEYFKVRHCFLVSSGKAALTLILSTLKEMFPEKNEVLIPAFTCYSVPSAIVRAGLKITLCDIDPETLDFDFKQLPVKFRNPGLLCIIPTHLFGVPADIDRIKKLIGNLPVPIVEDAAQALGGNLNGKKLGTFGDVGFVSLGRGKAFSTVEGGIIITNNNDIAELLAERVKQLDHYSFKEATGLFINGIALMIFLHPLLFWFPKLLPFLKLGETLYDPGFKIRQMTGFQAGLAWSWKKKLKNFQKKRHFTVEQYLRLLPETFIFAGIIRNKISSLLRFPIKTGNEERMQQILQQGSRMGLGISIIYPDSINKIKSLEKVFHDQDFPAAGKVAKQTITLPAHGFITPNDQKKILNIISSI